MAVSRVKTSSILQGFPKSRSLLAGNSAYQPSSFESIATITVGVGGSSTIQFSGIPSTYKSLQLRYLAQWDYVLADYSDVNLTVNTSTSYAYHLLQGSGSAVSAGGQASQSTAYTDTLIPSGSANTFGVAVIDFIDYASTTKNKTIRSIGGFDANGSGYIALSSILSNNTAAINTITLSASKFAINSVFALYGIKG